MPGGDDERWLSAEEADDLDLLRRAAADALASDLPPATAADLGWTGLLTPPDLGGEGWYPSSAVAVATETGAAVHPSGWTAAALASAALGAITPTAAFGVARAGDGRGGRWTGTARVLSDAGADVVVLVAADGSSTWTMPLDSPGLTTTAVDLDTTRSVVDVTGRDVQVAALDADGSAILGAALLLGCADSVGALRSTSSVVSSYLVDRQAFGVSLASMQVLQHRIVEHDVLCTAADALVRSAARRLETDPAPSIEVWAAPAYVHRRVVAALDDCIQLAGGIGFTWEFPVHHALRRAVVTETLGVGPTAAVELLATAAGW